MINVDANFKYIWIGFLCILLQNTAIELNNLMGKAQSELNGGKL